MKDQRDFDRLKESRKLGGFFDSLPRGLDLEDSRLELLRNLRKYYFGYLLSKETSDMLFAVECMNEVYEVLDQIEN